MKQRSVMGAALALLSIVLLCSSGCEKLSQRFTPEIDYELMADMIAERVDERLEMRELERERERRVAAGVEEAQETSTARVASGVTEESRVVVEEPAKGKYEEYDVLVPVKTPAKAPAEVPEEVPLKILDLPEKAIDVGGIALTLVEIPAGEFLMGSPAGKGMEHEHPRHKTSITRPFYLGRYEVTQAQWTKVMGDNPSYFKGSDLPVESVSWNDVQKFIAKLNTMTGEEFRLPTEAEWEYACRAGSNAQYYFGDNEDKLDEYAWYTDNSEGRTHPAGKKKPNSFGLHDMLGNVWEWCADWYSKTYYDISPKDEPRGPASGKHRILRGGAWHYSAIGLRPANRYYQSPEYEYADTGFRIAQDAR
jgi:formylglycine-generating enzyme required for sulfatase activity